MQGSKFLKVMGIITLIFACIGIISAIISLAGIGLLTSLAELAGVSIPVGILTVALVIALIGAGIELVSGILGIKNWNKPEKVKSCILFGIITLVLCVISIVLTIVSYSDSFSVLSIITGLAVPVIYLIAAFLYKKNSAAS